MHFFELAKIACFNSFKIIKPKKALTPHGYLLDHGTQDMANSFVLNNEHL